MSSLSTPTIASGASNDEPMLPLALSNSVPMVVLVGCVDPEPPRAKFWTSASTTEYADWYWDGTAAAIPKATMRSTRPGAWGTALTQLSYLIDVRNL